VHAATAAREDEPRLKSNAIGFASALVIGLASTAPAYSLAAVVGLVTATVAFQSPAVLLVAFVPMLFISTAYFCLNRADPDCGTTFAWATRALGPTTGWLAGWAIIAGGVIVIGLLANTAATYAYLLVGLEAAAADRAAVMALAVAIIVLMTYVTLKGIEMSARTQVLLIVAQLSAVALFAAVALVRVLAGDGIATSAEPAAEWFSPFAIDGSSALVGGALIAVFVYWGWDSAVTVNEETRDSAHAPGRAAVLSTIILLGLYLLVTVALLAWSGAGALGAFEDETAFNVISGQVLGSPWDKVVILAVLTSALAATQTTVLPSSRTALSMARAGAFPPVFARIHPRYRTPGIATIAIGALAVLVYVGFRLVSESFYASAIAALGLLICVNYGLNGLSCAVFHRRVLLRSGRNLVLMGLAPLIGFAMFAYVLVRSVHDFTLPGVEGVPYWFGLQAPLVVAVGLFLLAGALIVAWRSRGGAAFFARRPEAYAAESAPPAIRATAAKPAIAAERA
jgi:amino acid transporter